MRIHTAGRPLPDEEATAFMNNESNEAAWRGADAPAEAGQLMNTALPIGGAMFRDRAEAALGLPRRADERAEFHERFVELRARV